MNQALPTIAQQTSTLAQLLTASARAERAIGQADQAARYQRAAAHAAAAALVLLGEPPTVQGPA